MNILQEEKNQLETLLRNTILPEAKISPDSLAAGEDTYQISFTYNASDTKNRISNSVNFTWDEIFKMIASGFYQTAVDTKRVKQYIEESLGKKIKPQFDEINRQQRIYIENEQIETILWQFKTIGYMMLKHGSNDYQSWTEWTLTPKGEEYFTQLTVEKRSAA